MTPTCDLAGRFAANAEDARELAKTAGLMWKSGHSGVTGVGG